jgi:hypothetical protein
VSQGADLLPELQPLIEQAIEDSKPAWRQFVEDNRAREDDTFGFEEVEAGPPKVMVVKYVPSFRAKDYLYPPPPFGRLFNGNKDFTWGKAVYVTGIEEPLSTAIYGRVGLVSYIEPKDDWKVFDARVPANEALYVRWLQLQPDYRDAVVTVHSDHFLHNMRTYFREQFEVDVVLCHPDEFDLQKWYVDANHTWLAVSDWIPNTFPKKLAGGPSPQFRDVYLTIVAEEEFAFPDEPKPELPRPARPLERSAQLGVSRAGPRLIFTGTGPLAATNVRQAYWRHEIVRVLS